MVSNVSGSATGYNQVGNFEMVTKIFVTLWWCLVCYQYGAEGVGNMLCWNVRQVEQCVIYISGSGELLVCGLGVWAHHIQLCSGIQDEFLHKGAVVTSMY